MQTLDPRLVEIEFWAKFGLELAEMTRNFFIPIHQYGGAGAQGTPFPYSKYESKEGAIYSNLIMKIMDGIV